MEESKVLAVDFGASSGRIMLGSFDGRTITIKEIHRFSNDPVIVNGTMYWDVLRLFYEIKQGILKSKPYGKIDSIAVDTWGVDFGLLDERGYLLENPIHYRDSRTQGMMDIAFGLIPKEEFYHESGNQFMEINTAFQLLSLSIKRPEVLERAHTLLMMPDLFNYFLSGIKKDEKSIVSTTQLSDPYGPGWAMDVVGRLKLPTGIFTEVVPTGTTLGPILKAIQDELEVSGMDVVAVAGHDTQCAIASVPTSADDFIFISCGTWSLFGTELDAPLINRSSEELNITNETGVDGKTSFLKNIIGLWLIQESRRQWIREGEEYSFSELEKMASATEPFKCFIDPDDPLFVPAGNVPQRIKEYCVRTGQEIPLTKGEIVRCIDESLALKYRYTLEEIMACTGKDYKNINIVGGGTNSELLCQFTASSCGLDVIAGPIEATVYGNIGIQLMAQGKIKDLKELRHVIKVSEDPVIYKPKEKESWEKAYQSYKEHILKP